MGGSLQPTSGKCFASSAQRRAGVRGHRPRALLLIRPAVTVSAVHALLYHLRMQDLIAIEL